MKVEKLKLKLEKLFEDAKVLVKDNVITLYAQESKVYPLFNNIGEEMQISENIPQTLLEIKTGIYLSGLKGYIGNIVLDKELDRQGLILYTNTLIHDDTLSVLVQNLGRKKITILKGQEIAKIIFTKKEDINVSITEFEVK